MWIVIGNVSPGIATIGRPLEAVLADEPTLLAVHKTHRSNQANTGYLIPIRILKGNLEMGKAG